MKKVSILTPVYGVEKYIETCARSLFEQTYGDIEYIFVNDCTKDHSIEVLESIVTQYPERKQQVRIIHHPHNKGVGAARQTALLAATGDYIMFVDSDDHLPTNTVELLVNKALTSDADLIDGGYTEGDKPTQMPTDIPTEKYLKLLICQNVIANRLWGRLYRRALVEQHKIYFQEGIDYSEDLFWNTQYMYYAKREVIEANVYYYRTDNINSYCHNPSEKNSISYFKSCHLMSQFLETADTKGIYRKAVDIGCVNAYRWAAKAHIDFPKVDQLLAYNPKSAFIRFIISLIKKGIPMKCVNLLYLSYRRLYVRSVLSRS